MINKNEVIGKAEEFDIHTSDVQRDYVFGWVLAGIYTVSTLQDHLMLKGGSCLRKAYFEHYRFSQDLDFSTTGALQEDFICTELNKVCEFVQQNTGVIFEKDRTKVAKEPEADPDKTIYKAKLYFKDFFGNPDKFTISIRLDVKQFDRIFLPIQKRNLIHPYSDYASCAVSLKCLKLEEILASKLKCLLQRRHVADFYDFAFSILLNSNIKLDKKEIVDTFLRITIFRPSPGIVKGLLFDLPFQIIKTFWHKYLVFPKRGFIDFDKAVDSFKTTIDDLFGSLPIGRGQQTYFLSHLRNPIMEAGYTMTLLGIVYDGIQRLVEPYSLVYKIRKDEVAREYLYVYDRTGGRNSGPSIKRFLHPKIQSITNTDTKFEPRYEVELSKAGEPPKSSYFTRTSRGLFSKYRVSSPRRTIKSSAYKYILECPICGKRFRRKKYSTKLNPHKNKYGNKCYGRTGHIF